MANKRREMAPLVWESKKFPNKRREDEEELAAVWCKSVIVTHANDLRAEKWYRQTSEAGAKQVFSISERARGKTESESGTSVLSQ